METVIDVEIDYDPRSQFVDFHKRPNRWSCIVAHRRAGKTVACVMDLVLKALRCDKPNGRFGYIAPHYVQAKDVAWSYVKQAVADLVPHGAKINESELKVELPNGAWVKLYGADNYDRLRGLYFDGLVLDEYADFDPRAWEVIRPTLSDRRGWCVWIGTPKGHNSFYDIWAGNAETGQAGAINDPEWFSLLLKASQTGILPDDELKDARKTLSEDQYAQEYECSFEAAIHGAYYGKLIARAKEEGRVCSVPHEPGSEVHTGWDLGIGDSTAIWFAQLMGREIRIIDYYEASGVGIDHYVGLVKSKPYVYGEHLLPHDSDKSELGTGRTLTQTIKGLGLTPRVLPRQSIEDGINAARLLIPKCWFDAEKCKRGIEALMQYRCEYDDKLKTFKLRPLHDWTSHAADAFRYLATGIRPAQRWEPLPKPRVAIV